jgi:CBS domain containing-hemolysin-like protein
MLRPFGIAPGGHEHVHTSAEIELLLGESQRAGALSPEAHRQLQRGLSLSKRTARQLMVPRVDMLAVEVSTPIAEVLKELLASPYSRLPVYDGTLDQVLGTVSAKDITALYARQQPIPPLRQLLRPIPFVPDLLPAEKLIRVMQDEKSSKAIVVDEFGGVQGIISVEDVLGELFGDIADELKEYDGTDIEQLPDGRKKLLGSMPLIDAEPFLGVRWAGEAATLGGHITGLLGRLPAAGERFVIDGVEVTIIERTPSAIKAVAIKPRPDREASA